MEQTSQASVPQRLVDTVRQRATEQLDSQKGRATDGLHAIAQAVRGSTQQLRDEQHDVVADYVERAADRIEAFSAALRERTWHRRRRSDSARGARRASGHGRTRRTTR